MNPVVVIGIVLIFVVLRLSKRLDRIFTELADLNRKTPDRDTSWIDPADHALDKDKG